MAPFINRTEQKAGDFSSVDEQVAAKRAIQERSGIESIYSLPTERPAIGSVAYSFLRINCKKEERV